ncbi:MAG: DUF4434 domain-containing protein [Clostridia bacterium]|nr:DUF4434 domain-containing protein [Clostridia bacterium]
MFTFSKIISAVLAFVMMMLPTAKAPEQQCKPEFSGSFIQSWMTCSWDDERWAEEAENMKEAGVEYLVLQSLADMGYKADGGHWNVYYDTDVEALKDGTYGGDCLEPALKACQEAGIKVFVGLSMFDDFWNESGMGSLYQDVCRVAGDMVEDIYGKYGEKYKDSLYGWYFTPEISNGLLCQLSISGIIKGINHLIDRINEVDAAKPLLMSPFYSEYIATGPIVTLSNYVRFFDKVNFRDGDIFAPQDAIGAKWTREKNLEMTWRLYKAAVDTCDADIKLWANCENFDGAVAEGVLEGLLSPKATEHTSNVTATLDTFVRQMDIASKYAENIITFSYNHYYSPSNVNPAFINTYYDYVAKGYQLETLAPQAPENMKKQQTENGVELSWDEAEDNMGIAYYRLEKDGKFLARIDKYYGWEENSYTDENASADSIYTIEAVDAAGNTTGKITIG